MDFLNTIFYKSLVALYELNIDKNKKAKNILVGAIYEALLMGKDGLDEAKLEMSLETATGYWLDYWGDFYGVLRVQGEKDDLYRERIIEEIISPKCTIPSLRGATARYINLHHDITIKWGDIRIFEPWTHLLILDTRGTLDGGGRMISYDYWNYSVVDISLPDSSLITKELIEYLNKIKAGGVRLVFSISPQWDVAIDPIKDEKIHNVEKEIIQKRCMEAKPVIDAFRLRTEHPCIDDPSTGSRLDTSGFLDGSRCVYWGGIELKRPYYVTGALKDHRYSAVINLGHFESLLEKENVTIEEGIQLEELSLQGTREKEGRLTMTQTIVGIRQTLSSIYKGSYIPYTKVGSARKQFLFPEKNLFDYMSFKELCDKVPKVNLEEIEEASQYPCVISEKAVAKALRSIATEKIRRSNRTESQQMPLLITTSN